MVGNKTHTVTEVKCFWDQQTTLQSYNDNNTIQWDILFYNIGFWIKDIWIVGENSNSISSQIKWESEIIKGICM